MASRVPLSRLDALVLALGALGLLAFLLLLPRHHPDAAADFRLGEAEALARAEAFLAAAGYDTQGMQPLVLRARRPGTYNALQDSAGRRTALRALRGGARAAYPVYDWQVAFRTPAGFTADIEAPAYVVRLTHEGRPWAFRRAGDRPPVAEPDPEALARIGADAAADPAALRFSLDPDAAPAPGRLGPEDAEALARYYLERSAFAALPMRVDSVEAVGTGGGAAARVRFSGTEPALGQEVAVSVDVSAWGRLLEMRSGKAEIVTTGITISGNGGAREAVRWIAFGVLILWLLVVVVRRLAARLLDTRSALGDAMIAAALAAISLLLNAPSLQAELGSATATLLVFLLIGTLFYAAAIGLLVFVTSAGSDAVERAAGRTTLQTTRLARMGLWANVPVGRSLLLGAALAGVFAGAGALVLALVPEAPLPLNANASTLTADASYAPVVMTLMMSFWASLVLVQAGVVSVSAVAHRLRPWLVVPAVAVAVAVLQTYSVPLPLGTPLQTILVALAFGAVVALGYRATDALALLTGLTLAGTLWFTAEGLVIPGVGLLDFGLALAGVGAVAGIGVYGLARGGSEASLPAYEPEFIADQRVRARLQREFEIAREVQQSFLPRRVPDVAGLDLAARCDPAQEVGGDYYDLIPLGPERLAVVVGDVSGKGIQAAFFMTLVKGFLQTLAREHEDPAAVLSRLNALFRANAPRGTFVTILYGVLDRRTGTLTFARAGHTPLLIRRATGGVAALRPPGLAIGMADSAIFDEALAPQAVALGPGDTLALYTDGLSEARDHERRLFSDERLARLLAEVPAPAGEALEALQAAVHAHAGPDGLHDDLTTVIIRILTLTDARAASAEARAPDLTPTHA